MRWRLRLHYNEICFSRFFFHTKHLTILILFGNEMNKKNSDIDISYKELLTKIQVYYSGLEDDLCRYIELEDEFMNIVEIFNKLTYSSDFNHRANLEPFINLLDKINFTKQKLVWALIFEKYSRSEKEDPEKDEEKKLILSKVSTVKNPLILAFLLNIPNIKINKTEWENAINSKSIELFSFKISSFEDLLEKTQSQIEEVTVTNKYAHYQFHSLLNIFLNSFSNIPRDTNNKIPKHEIRAKIPLFLEELLDAFSFSEEGEKEPLIKLFKGFAKVENVLFTSMKEYREHLIHSFHVFLLGLQWLLVEWNMAYSNDKILFKFTNSDFMCWTFTSFFHDIGYGIEKLNQISSEIDLQYSVLGKAQSIEFRFSESTRLFARELMELMSKLLVTSSITGRDNEEYRFLRITPIMRSWDLKKHGLVSAILFMKTLNDIVVNNYGIYIKHKTDWDRIFLRAALAMTIHTYPSELTNYLDVEKETSGADEFNYVKKPIFYAFVLIVVDLIEFLERPTFSGDIYVPLIQDIDVELDIKYKYHTDRTFETFIVARYNHSEFRDINLIEIGKKIIERLYGFYSNKHGVDITIINNNSGNKLRFPFLISEENEFLNFISNNKDEEQRVRMMEWLAVYSTFRKTIMHLDDFEEETDKLLPIQLSNQIIPILRRIQPYRAFFKKP